MVLTTRQFCKIWWREVLKKVKKAVVFIDNDAAECLHWNGGLFELISSGAVCVKEFSSFEKGEENQKKAVFITSSSMLQTSRVILQDLIQNSSFEYCVLMTGVHPSVHQFARYGGHREGVNDMAAFHSLEEDMLRWMGNLNYTVEVFYIPLFLVPVTETMFLTPPFRDLFPLLEADVQHIRELQTCLSQKTENFLPKSLSSVEMSSLPLELQICLRHLVTSLHSFFTQLDVREDIFSMGYLSGLIAGHLENLPVATSRRKNAENRCSLILIDRTLDLCTATSHGSDSLLDRILAVLPHLPRHSSDVAVNMSLLSNTTVASVVDDVVLAPGCLAHSQEEHCPQVLEWLITRRQKDVLLGLHELLATVVPNGREERNSRLAPRVTPHSLEKQVATFKGRTEELIQNAGLLQQTLAVTQTLKSPQAAQLEQVLSMEKLLFLSLCSSKDMSSIQEQIRMLIQTRHERGLLLEQMLAILIHLYSLSGTYLKFSSTEERQLQAALYWALLQDKNKLPSGLTNLVPPDADEEAINKTASRIVDRLQSIAHARKDLTKYRSLLNNQHGDVQNAAHSGLLQRLAGDLVDPARPDLTDLTCRSAGLKELLKSGFSMLLNRPRQQHPLENPLVVVFVLGGVTAQEVRLVQETVANATPTTQVLVGSTRIVTAMDIVEAVLVKDPLMQEIL